MNTIARTKPGTILTPTGSAPHHQDGAEIEGITRLDIAGEGGGFYLFHFDAEGRNRIDTWHDTVEEALDQAAFEYGLDRGAWEFTDRA